MKNTSISLTSNQPFFSVVIPLFNKDKYIKRTLDSVLSQSFQDFEIVVIDDGSNDDSYKIVSSFDDLRVRLIRVPNGGVSAARNYGINVSLGKWIAFLDADDWYHPEHLSTLSGIINQYQGARYVATGYRTISEVKLQEFDGWNLGLIESNERIDDLPKRWMHGATFFTSSIAVERELLSTVQPCFPVGESHGEDLDLWFRLAEICDVYYNAVSTVGRIWVEDSLSAQQTKIVIPPFILRMRDRTLNKITPVHLHSSTVWFVNQQLLTMARKSCAQGDRRAGKIFFSQVVPAMTNSRWWVTLILLYLVPMSAVHSFQRWRTLRRMDIQ